MIELSIRRKGEPTRTQILQPGVHRIGRADDNEIVLDDVEVSRHHAQLIMGQDGHIVVEDLQSGNGTLVHGVAIRQHHLKVGEQVEITPFKLTTAQAKAVPALVVIEGSPLGHHYYLREDALSIGRGEDQDIVLDDHTASRSHAILVVSPDGWALRDVGSANGMLVNGQEVRDIVLSDGDQVLLGDTLLRFDDASAPKRQTPQEPEDTYLAALPHTPPVAAVAPTAANSFVSFLPLLMVIGLLFVMMATVLVLTSLS